MSTNQEKLSTIALMLAKIRSDDINILIKLCGSAVSAWNANIDELVLFGMDFSAAAALQEKKKHVDFATAEKILLNYHGSIITKNDADYPALLKYISSPPPMLFSFGDLKVFQKPLVAVVGARKLTPYGKSVTEAIASLLAGNGICVVSGLAYGADICAHRAAISVSGKTVAVLGSGIDNIYPIAHKHVAEKIIDTYGAVITEFLPDTPALPHHFPQRNRIIAGMVNTVIVTEGALHSGSLITAGLGLEYGKDILAVPGNIFSPQSRGTNHLIAEGALPVTCLDDIVNYFKFSSTTTQAENLSKDEQTVLSTLSSGPQHIDKICQATKLDVQILNACLTSLELKQLVIDIGGSYIRKKNNV